MAPPRDTQRSPASQNSPQGRTPEERTEQADHASESDVVASDPEEEEDPLNSTVEEFRSTNRPLRDTNSNDFSEELAEDENVCLSGEAASISNDSTPHAAKQSERPQFHDSKFHTNRNNQTFHETNQGVFEISESSEEQDTNEISVYARLNPLESATATNGLVPSIANNETGEAEALVFGSTEGIRQQNGDLTQCYSDAIADENANNNNGSLSDNSSNQDLEANQIGPDLEARHAGHRLDARQTRQDSAHDARNGLYYSQEHLVPRPLAHLRFDPSSYVRSGSSGIKLRGRKYLSWYT